MKTYFRLSIIFIVVLVQSTLSFAQTELPLSKQWEAVDSLMLLQRPQSAIVYLEKIAVEAEKKNDQNQYILARGLDITLQKYQSERPAAYLNKFESEAKKATDPVAKSLWYTITANSFFNYFDENRSKIYDNRSFTDSSDDYAKHTVNQILNKARFYYLEALKNETILKQIPVQSYASLFENVGKNNLKDENIYISVLHNALQFFKDHAQYSVFDRGNKVYEAKKYLISHNEFMAMDLPITDSTLNFDVAMRLYQDLMRFYSTKGDVENELYYEIERLKYLSNLEYRKNVRLYKKLIDQIATDYPKLNTVAMAKYYGIEIMEYNKDTFFTDKKAKLTLELANAYKSIIEEYPNTKGASLAKIAFNILSKQSLNITTELVALPNENIRTLVKYANIDTLKIEVFKTNANPFNNTPKPPGKALYTHYFKLPKAEDMESHSVELNLGKLPLGQYLLVFSGDSVIVTKDLQVSNIATLENASVCYFLNRKTGIPMVNVEQYWLIKEQNNANWIATDNHEFATAIDIDQRDNWLQKKINVNTTLRDSFNNDYENKIYWAYVFNNDTLIESQDFILKKGSNVKSKKPKHEEKIKIYYFVDRPIYRPGQKVNFKAFVLNALEQQEGKSKVLANRKINVEIEDAEGDVIFEQAFVSNDFGTFSGAFVIPENANLGEFSINDSKSYGYSDFLVEAYKKPSLEIKFDSGSRVLPPNQWVTVEGRVQYMSGAPASYSQIEASVGIQKVDKIDYWYLSKESFKNRSGDEILDTVFKADENGRFKLTFFSTTDSLDSGGKYPYSYFDIELYATDHLGEETYETNAYVSNLSPYAVHLWINKNTTADQFKAIDLEIFDHESKPLKENVRLKITELEKPKVFLKERLWSAPSELYYSIDSLQKLFPNEEIDIKVDNFNSYNDYDSQISNRPIKRIVLDTIIDNESIKKLKFSNKDWPHSTYYKFEVFDTNGFLDSSDAIQYAFIYNDDDPIITDKALHLPNFSIDNGKLEQTSKVAAYVANPTLFFYNSTRKKIEIKSNNTFKWKADFSKSNDIVLSWAMIRDNRIYSGRRSYSNPNKNKNIRFKIEIPQQVLQPGQKVSWPIEISNDYYKSNHFEILATIYDAALEKLIDSDERWWKSRELISNRHKWNNYYRNLFWFARLICADHKSEDYTVEYIPIKKNVLPKLRQFGSTKMYKLIAENELNIGNIFLEVDATEDELNATVVYGQKIDRRSYTGVLNEVSYAVVIDDFFTSTINEVNTQNVRKNFTESAYFNAHLTTDKKGKAYINFTVPDALSKWKLRLLAHDKLYNVVEYDATIITQKELIVSPHLPRFFRQSDSLDLNVKVSNLSNTSDSVLVLLAIKDVVSGNNINHEFGLVSNTQKVLVPANASQFVSFPIKVPANRIDSVEIITTVKESKAEDGEAHIINILSSKQLLNEYKNIYLNNNPKADFEFTALKEKLDLVTTESMSIQSTSDPILSNLQSMAFLANYPYNCTEQILNKYVGLILAKNVLDSNKDLRTAIKMHSSENKADIKALQQLNEATKFNIELEKIVEKIEARQNKNGSFSWFEGMPEDQFISVYTLTQMAKLKQLKLLSTREKSFETMLDKGILYLDDRQLNHINNLAAKKKPILLDQQALDWLYLNSFFPNRSIHSALSEYNKSLYQIAEKNWQSLSNKNQATLAMCWQQTGATYNADIIIQSLLERSIKSEDQGRYWNWNGQLKWTTGDIAAHATILEACISQNVPDSIVQELQIWLLKNKKGDNWGTTINTAATQLAFWKSNFNQKSKRVPFEVNMGNKHFTFKNEDAVFSLQNYEVPKSDINSKMANISIRKLSEEKMFVNANIHWRYAQDLSQVGASDSNALVNVSKKMYLIDGKGKEQSFSAINENSKLTIGDKLLVRITIDAKKDLSYILLKDMRCTAVEPVEKLSTFKYNNGIGYYQSHNDAVSNFFFSDIKKGIWQIEYEILVNQSGSFETGIISLEDMYQPEINALNKGIRIQVQ